jgi:DNA polymerase IV
MTLRCLFVDFNSYFASVEQQDEPALRGRPVGVVPVMAPTTCCIAASVEAKRHGVGTGTAVWEALEKCPDIVLVQARPARYVELHHRLMDAIADCIPHGKAQSIDEVPCRLIGRERNRGNAEAIAGAIKRRIAGEFDWIRCSIGIAPNGFLAKTASDMRKPDGLTVLEASDLPHALHGLELRDLCGIGPSMERRLQRAGIDTVERLCAASRERLRAAWGGIEGERYWLQLRGFDLPERTARRGSIGHSHVLGPELRSFEGMRSVLFKLLAKAAMRLRREGFLAAGMAIRVRLVGMEQRFERDLRFAPVDDTSTLLRLLGGQLDALERAIVRGRWDPRRHPPLSVAVTLLELEPGGSVGEELLPALPRSRRLSQALDGINRKFGNNALYFGAMQQAIARDAAPMRIPFQTIPDGGLEEDNVTRKQACARSASPAEELWLARARQFKVLAEASHRQARERRSQAHGGDEQARRYGATGRGSASTAAPALEGAQGSLF